MKWFKLYADLQHHQKRYRLESILNTDYGMHYITNWFCFVCRYAQDGNLSHVTKPELARSCEWKGDPDLFWEALVSAGFIEPSGNTWVVHGWTEEHNRFIEENARRKAIKTSVVKKNTVGQAWKSEENKQEKRPEGNPSVTQVKNRIEEKKDIELLHKGKENTNTNIKGAPTSAVPPMKPAPAKKELPPGIEDLQKECGAFIDDEMKERLCTAYYPVWDKRHPAHIQNQEWNEKDQAKWEKKYQRKWDPADLPDLDVVKLLRGDFGKDPRILPRVWNTWPPSPGSIPKEAAAG